MIDRQLEGQTTSTPFMSIKDTTGCSNRNVLFDIHNVVDAKIDIFTALLNKLSTKKYKASYAIQVQKTSR